MFFLIFFSEYDFCQILVDNGDQLCDQMPEGQPCGCPLLANTWDLKGVKVPVPDFGILNNLMVVSYHNLGYKYILKFKMNLN